jgi:hypothetical protein
MRRVIVPIAQVLTLLVAGTLGDAAPLTVDDVRLLTQLDPRYENLPGEYACAVWRAELPRAELALLVALCPSSKPQGPSHWLLYVADSGLKPRQLARADLGRITGLGASVRGELRVRDDVLPGEAVLEVSRGEASEGDRKTVTSSELWRWRNRRLGRIFAQEQGGGGGPGSGALMRSWVPAPAVVGRPPALDASLGEAIWDGATLQRGPDHHFRYTFDGSRFRPPSGALLLSASAWLPPARGARYEPSLAVDGLGETAWCTAKRPGVAAPLHLELLEPRRLRALRIVPGYARSQGSFLDNARVRRVRIRTDQGAAFEVELPDRMKPQRIPLPRRAGKVGAVDLTILSVRAGRRAQDVCISEIAVE